MIDDVIGILIKPFIISKVTINNFTVVDELVSIEIEISSEEVGIKHLLFENVKALNIDANYYAVQDRPSIIIEDISEAQLEGVRLKVSISEDIMTFYCVDVKML